MTVALKQGHYTLLKSAKAALRTHLDASITEIVAEGVTDYVPDNVQTGADAGAGMNIYASDRRIPPQATQTVLLKCRADKVLRRLGLGVKDRLFILTATCTVKRDTKASSGTDPSPTPEDAGWQTAGVLASLVEDVLVKEIPQDSSNTAYMIKPLPHTQGALNPRASNQYTYNVPFEVTMRVRSSLGE